MARAAVIPQSPPKRATRGRAKGSTTTKTAGKQNAKTTKAVETRKRNARIAVSHTNSESEEETEDEIEVIDSKSRGKTAAKGKSTGSTKSGRGRKAAAAVAPDSESESDDDELAQSSAPKKKAGRPKTKAAATAKEDGTTTTTTKPASRGRGRPKGTSVKVTAGEDLLRENTRRNERLQDSDDLSSSQQGPTEIFIATGSAMLRGPAKKKKVTFQEMSDSDESELSEVPAPTTTRRRRGTIVAKDVDGMGAKPVRKAPTPSTRGRKPGPAKKGGAKPLSPKKATQVAKAYASSDGEDDELNGEKDAIKLVVHSPQKRGSGITGLGSPVRRINLSPNKASKTVDENGEPTVPSRKSFDFNESQFMSSPARRLPASPFHFTLKETPKRAGLTFNDNTKLARPESTPTQNSPLRTSPKKAKLGTPGPGSLFGHSGNGASQPNSTPAQNSPLKTSPKKGIFGASFSSQQPSHQASTSTPFKSSMLLSPAKKVSTPFKSSLPPVPSSLAKESQIQADADTDDETVSMYDESPSREQNFEGGTVFDAHHDEHGTRLTPDGSPVTRGSKNSEKKIPAQSDYFAGFDKEADEDSDDELAALEAHDHAEDDEHADQQMEELIQEVEAEFEETNMQAPFDFDQDEEESTTPQDSYKASSKSVGLQEDSIGDRRSDTQEDDSDMEIREEPTQSVHRRSFVDGLEDVFTESSPRRDAPTDNATHDMDDRDNYSISDDEAPDNVSQSARTAEEHDEPTLVGENTSSPSRHPMSADPIQPYEIEEVEHTPFISFLLNHWAPTLPLVEELHSTSISVQYTERRSPRSKTPEDSQNDVPNTPSVSSTPESQEEHQDKSLPTKGPRFTLLAEQFSQWKASSPAKPETDRPRRRGVFSLGRPGDVSRTTPQAPKTDIFANAPSFSAKLRSQPAPHTSPAVDTNEELDIHEDPENPVDDEVVESKIEHGTRSPMAEIMDDEAPEAPELFSDSPRDEAEGQQPKAVNYPTLQPSVEEEKENDEMSFVPATPAKNPSLPPQTFHTMSKVPLKPEGQISPLKIMRKRGRSLSITSPVRSSPRLRNFLPPPKAHRVSESPPRKSPRIQEESVQRSRSREPSIETQQVHRARTPSRSASPSKTPRKQVSDYELCLRGAVVFVDVHTTEGEDASGIFIELLQQMGAKCIRNWSWNPRMSLSPEEGTPSLNGKVGITHVVFKDGGVRTLEKVRQASGLVKCVGVGWVLEYVSPFSLINGFSNLKQLRARKQMARRSALFRRQLNHSPRWRKATQEYGTSGAKQHQRNTYQVGHSWVIKPQAFCGLRKWC